MPGSDAGSRETTVNEESVNIAFTSSLKKIYEAYLIRDASRSLAHYT